MNPSRPKPKAVGAVDGQGTVVLARVSDGAIAPCPSSTRDRPCCDERNAISFGREMALVYAS